MYADCVLSNKCQSNEHCSLIGQSTAVNLVWSTRMPTMTTQVNKDKACVYGLCIFRVFIGAANWLNLRGWQWCHNNLLNSNIESGTRNHIETIRFADNVLIELYSQLCLRGARVCENVRMAAIDFVWLQQTIVNRRKILKRGYWGSDKSGRTPRTDCVRMIGRAILPPPLQWVLFSLALGLGLCVCISFSLSLKWALSCSYVFVVWDVTACLF